MKQKDIKVGHNYADESGKVTRFVVEVSMDVRPGTALTRGVRYVESGPGGMVIADRYLDTFAQWAHKEVKP